MQKSTLLMLVSHSNLLGLLLRRLLRLGHLNADRLLRVRTLQRLDREVLDEWRESEAEECERDTEEEDTTQTKVSSAMGCLQVLNSHLETIHVCLNNEWNLNG